MEMFVFVRLLKQGSYLRPLGYRDPSPPLFPLQAAQLTGLQIADPKAHSTFHIEFLGPPTKRTFVLLRSLFPM